MEFCTPRFGLLDINRPPFPLINSTSVSTIDRSVIHPRKGPIKRRPAPLIRLKCRDKRQPFLCIARKVFRKSQPYRSSCLSNSSYAQIIVFGADYECLVFLEIKDQPGVGVDFHVIQIEYGQDFLFNCVASSRVEILRVLMTEPVVIW